MLLNSIIITFVWVLTLIFKSLNFTPDNFLKTSRLIGKLLNLLPVNEDDICILTVSILGLVLSVNYGAQAEVCKELIVFIQFGDDSSGSRWLDHLDTGLTAAKEDIVFTVSHTDYGKYANFKEMIKAGLIDNRV